jgi:hypothetical protein
MHGTMIKIPQNIVGSFPSNWQYYSNLCATSCFFDFSPANVVIGEVPRVMKNYSRGSSMEETSCFIMAYCMDKQRSGFIPLTKVVMNVDFSTLLGFMFVQVFEVVANLICICYRT